MKKNRLPAILVGFFLIINYIFSVGFYLPTEISWKFSSDIALISSFTTTFKNSIEERKHNIKLGAKYLDKAIVYPGEEFSFNDVVGARTRERGYKEAKVIFNSEYVDGFGGGICQLSTTLYNAILFSNLKVIESHPHTLQASYVLPSFDAMVSYGVFDLRFLNDTNSVIYLRVYTSGESVTVNVYAKKLAKGVEIRRKSKILRYIQPPKDRVVGNEAFELKEGESIREEYLIYPKKGLVSESYLEIYQGGVLSTRKLLRRDTYQPIQGVKQIFLMPSSFEELPILEGEDSSIAIGE